MLNTASSLITFNDKLEDQAVKFYEELARNEKYAEGRETFLAFARENKKHKAAVTMAYRYVITDAIEACFLLKDLNEGDYEVNTELTAGMSYSDILKMAIEVEKKTQKYCTDAGETSRGLLHDISDAFLRMAKRKAKRELILKSLLEKAMTQR